MHAPLKTTRRSRAVQAVLGIVIVLLSVFALGVSTASAVGGNPGPVHPANGVGSITNSQGQTVTFGGTPSTTGTSSVGSASGTATDPASVASAKQVTAAQAADPNATASNVLAPRWTNAHDVESLPAWRWNRVELDFDDGGWLTNPIKQFPVMVGDFLLILGGLIWQILLMVLKIGLSGQVILEHTASAVNFCVAWLGSNIMVFAILFWAWAAFRIVKQIFTLHWVEAFKNTFVFLALFGTLYYVSGQSAYAVENYSTGAEQLQVVGTMPWFANKAVNFGQKIVAPLTDPVTKLNQGKCSDLVNNVTSEAAGESGSAEAAPAAAEGCAGSSVGAAGGNQAMPNCASYITTIENAYAEGPDANRALIVASHLWQNTFYTSWQSGTFGLPTGNVDLPGRTMCHWAESVNDTPANEQYAVFQNAFANTPVSDETGMFGPFGSGSVGNDARRVAMTAWMACENTNEGKPWNTGAWAMGIKASSGTNMAGGSKNAPSCQEMFNSGVGDVAWGDSNANFWLFGDDVETNTPSDDAATAASNEALRQWGFAFSGGNGVDRILGGLLSVVIALLFLYCLGAMALGLLLAQLMAIACLMIALPIAFVLVAAGQRKSGMRLVKLTVSAVFAQVFFTVLLSMLILLTGLFQGVMVYLGAGVPGLFGTFLNAAAPLVAFFIIRQALKALGMGDILTAQGALSFATAATLSATGDSKLQRMARTTTDQLGNKKQSAMSKLPFMKKLGEFDKRFAPTPSNVFNKINPSVDARAERADEAARRKKAKADKAKERDEFLSKQVANRNLKGGKLSKWGRGLNWLDSRLKSDDPLRNNARKAALATAGGATVAGAAIVSGGLIPAVAAIAATATGGMGTLTAIGASAWGWRRWTNRNRGAALMGGPGGQPANDWDLQRADANDVDMSLFGDVDYTAKGFLDGPGSVENPSEAAKKFVSSVFAPALPGMDLTDSIVDRLAKLYDATQLATLGTSGRIFTADEQKALQVKVAEALGTSVDLVGVTATGLAVRLPREYSDFRQNGTMDDMRYFANYLPDEVRRPQTIRDGEGITRLERPDEYAVRIQAIGIAGGWLNPDGSATDVLAHVGIKFDDAGFAEDVAKWQAGAANKILDNLGKTIMSTLPDSATMERAIEASYRTVRPAEETIRREEVQYVTRTTEEAVRSQEALGVDGPELLRALADLDNVVVLKAQAAQAVETARNSNDAAAMEAAAARFTAANQEIVNRMEVLPTQMADVLGRACEAFAASAAVIAHTPQAYYEAFEENLDRMADLDEQHQKVMKDFLAGVTSLSETQEKLGKIQNDVKATLAKTTESVEAAKTVAANAANMANSGPRKPGAPMQSSQTVTSGADPIP